MLKRKHFLFFIAQHIHDKSPVQVFYDSVIMSSYGLPPPFIITENDVYSKGSTQKFSGWSLYSLWKYTVYKITVFEEEYLMKNMITRRK